MPENPHSLFLMLDISSIDFSECKTVNYLWPQMVNRLGIHKAQSVIRQSRDLQKIYGNKGTMPVVIQETCGLALTHVDLIRNQIGLSCDGSYMVLVLSIPKKAIQFLSET